MSETRHHAPSWPKVHDLCEQFAALVAHVATEQQAVTGRGSEEIAYTVGRAAAEHAEHLAEALVEAAEMSLDVWEATR